MKKLTRKNKLTEKIKLELQQSAPKIENIVTYVDDYEQDNINTIANLKKDKIYDIKRINGGLKQTIDAHGPITKLLIGSASKRIHGALLDHKDKSQGLSKLEKELLIGLIGSILFNGLLIILNILK